MTPPDAAVIPACPSSMPTAAAVAAAAVTAKITAMDVNATTQLGSTKSAEGTPPPSAGRVCWEILNVEHKSHGLWKKVGKGF